MHATLRRYEGVDRARSYELIEKVGDTLLVHEKARLLSAV